MSNAQLTRVQVYLDPEDILLLDRLSSQVKVTRSHIIREATKAVATRYAQVSSLLYPQSASFNPLKDLVGAEVSKTGRVGLHIDDIYTV